MKILLAVTGSISAYKAFDLTREYLRAGHSLRVILSKGAEQFVVPQVFRYLGAEAMYLSHEDFQYPKVESDLGSVLHIELAKWADKFVVAPMSANTLTRLARGEASDLISSVFLAIPQNKPILLFPAMNTNMLEHPFTQEHLQSVQRLKGLKQIFIHPTMEGELACGDIGSGKLAQIPEIVALTDTWTTTPNQSEVLITTGATVAPLDNVRYLTNSSSGITGFYLAKEALERGFKTTVIAGIYATEQLNLLKHHPKFQLIRVRTPNEMNEVVAKNFPNAKAYISSAAVGDIEFIASEGKLKKDKLADCLPIKTGVDILKNVISQKKAHQFIVGFAAEYELSEENLQQKMTRKNVDFLVGTKVDNGLLSSATVKGFKADRAEYAFYDRSGTIVREELSKSDMAKKVFNQVGHV